MTEQTTPEHEQDPARRQQEEQDALNTPPEAQRLQEAQQAQEQANLDRQDQADNS